MVTLFEKLVVAGSGIAVGEPIPDPATHTVPQHGQGRLFHI